MNTIGFFAIFLLLSSLFNINSLHAEEVKLKHNGMTLNANLEKADNWQKGPLLLMTHGTLAHNKMEIIATLQELLSEQGISSLAINLSLGLDDRHGFYDCATPHRHKHTDAIEEIGLWANWLKQQKIKQIVLLGHSRGGNQTAWYAAEHDSPLIDRVILIAPQTWSMEYARKDYKKRYGKALQPLLKKAHQLVDNGKGKTLLKPIDFIYCKDTSASAEAFVSYYSDDPRMDTPYLLDKIKKPLMVFAGTEDTSVKNLHKILPPLADKLGFQLMVIDGADHFFRDLYADEMVEAISDFITPEK